LTIYVFQEVQIVDAAFNPALPLKMVMVYVLIKRVNAVNLLIMRDNREQD